MLIEKIGRKLAEEKIPYAIVGGYAVALHGAVRGTIDIDLIVERNLKTYLAMEKALMELGFLPRLPVSAEDIFRFREEYIKNRNLIAWSFYNPKSPSEIVDIIITHDLTKMKKIVKKFRGLNLSVLSIDDLIKMKNESGRDQDKADIKALESLK